MDIKKIRENYINYVGNFNEIGEAVEKAAEIWPDRIAFVYNKQEKSYMQLRNDIAVLENILTDRGIKKNDRVALVCQNSYEWVIAYFSVIGVGAVLVPVDVEIPIASIGNLLNENNICKVICSDKFKNISDFSKAEILLTDQLYADVCSYTGDPVFHRNYEYNPDDICQISFTSGTTGKMKAVLLSSRNIIFDSIGAAEIINAKEGSKLLVILPFNHMFTITASLIIPIMCGARMFISSGKKYFLRELMEFKPNWLVVVPAIVTSVVKVASSAASSGTNPEMLSVIRELSCIVSGGATLDPKYIGILQKFGINIINGYGITECSPVVSANYPELNIAGSCGMPIKGCEIRINAPDSDGNGEIYVKGENVFCGYGDESDNKGVFDDGWFKTGDIGKLDKDGVLYITGRKKNLIIMENGKNVASEELESIIMLKVPEIEEVIVTGENGIIKAVIYSSDNDQDKIRKKISDLNRELPSYKQIKKSEFRNEPFEKTSSMKIIRK